MFTSISKKFFIYSISIYMLIFAAFFSIVYFTMDSYVEESGEHLISSEQRESRLLLEALINGRVSALKLLAEHQDSISFFHHDYNQFLKEPFFKKLYEYLEITHAENVFLAIEANKNMYILERSKVDFLQNPVGVLSEEEEEDYWYFYTRDHVKDFDLNTDVDRMSGIWQIWINIPVDDQGQVIGVIGSGLQDYEVRNAIYHSHFSGTMTLVVDDQGAIQYSNRISEIQMDSFDEKSAGEKSIYSYFSGLTFDDLEMALASNEESILHIKGNPYERLSITPIKDTDWNIVSYYNLEEIAGYHDIVTVAYIGLGVLLLAMILILLFLRRTTIKPIHELYRAVERYTAGETGLRYTLDAKDELGSLSRIIAKLQDSIYHQTEELESEVARRSKELEVAYKKISSNEKELQRFFESIPSGIFRFSLEGELLFGNHTFFKIMKINNLFMYNKLAKEKAPWPFVSLEKRDLLLKRVHEKEEVDEEELEVFNGEFEKIWVTLHIQAHEDLEGNFLYFEGIANEITEKKRLRDELIKNATMDALTNVLNRRVLLEHLGEELYRLKRHQTPFVFLMLDLDDFKRVNDHFGHIAGDYVLKEMAKIALNETRKTDYVGRLGGEEFGILFSHTHEEMALQLAERFRQKVEDYDFVFEDEHIQVTVSIGLTEGVITDSSERVYARVDQALYQAKKEGKNRIKTT